MSVVFRGRCDQLYHNYIFIRRKQCLEGHQNDLKIFVQQCAHIQDNLVLHYARYDGMSRWRSLRSSSTSLMEPTSTDTPKKAVAGLVTNRHQS